MKENGKLAQQPVSHRITKYLLNNQDDLKVQRSFALLRISARGSDAAQAPQLAERIRTLYTGNFPTQSVLAPWTTSGRGG
jgi:hypothetical protein